MSLRDSSSDRAHRPTETSLTGRQAFGEDRPVAAGDIRIASFGGERRLVLVLSVPDGHVLLAALASNEFEMATDQDLLVSSHEAGLPYPLVIESDVMGPLRPGLIGRRVGAVEKPLLALISRAATDGEFARELDLRRGLPLRDPDEPRSAWKAAEGRLFDAQVVAPAEMDAVTMLDPAVFSGGSAADELSMESVAIGLVQGRLTLGPRSCHAFVELAKHASSTRPWMMDAARYLTKAGLRDAPERTPAREGWTGPRRRSTVLPLEALLADVLETASRAARVLTVGEAWTDPLPGSAIEVRDSASVGASIHLMDCSEFVHGRF